MTASIQIESKELSKFALPIRQETNKLLLNRIPMVIFLDKKPMSMEKSWITKYSQMLMDIIAM
ncbi:hypothetical protein DHD32_01235 [Arenibacter sp. TNZ]|nr:hypothetical protein [Arenibacter sp. TNZ]